MKASSGPDERCLANKLAATKIIEEEANVRASSGKWRYLPYRRTVSLVSQYERLCISQIEVKEVTVLFIH